MRIRWLDEERV